MSEADSAIHGQIDHIFRHEYGKLVAILTKTFGPANMELAEDVVQEAMLDAIRQWSYEGIPQNPVGWIYKVARNKTINVIKQAQNRREKNDKIVSTFQTDNTLDIDLEALFSNQAIADDQLRMMFTCCHPSISADSQVALTLKTLCGFSIPEISQAFLTSEENINKRLVRARKTIREAEVPFEVPDIHELGFRLSRVLETIYLLFNEGYQATEGNELIRYELCEEAIRLAETVASSQHISDKSEVFALLALMSFNASRFKARIDDQDNLLNLEHQDRKKWNQELIGKGLQYLEFSASQQKVSEYQILAAISAHHCTAPNYESTDWQGILSLYDLLLQLSPSPLIELNRAVVISKINSPGEALEVIHAIKDQETLKAYPPYFTTTAELFYQNHQPEQALKHLRQAQKIPFGENYKYLITRLLEKYSKKN
ncbi:RNA polymerase sigma factor [Marinoscillum sp. MHG1-6]|uniref:RNA polymerase sigma factor n=1 Tax=Marinoscillum sp. MHG1-6 TaxID=2959627 RepID=UPI0021572ACE|nr:sigma-70 family RNA polymerase sigma factor [Marinoscillum sp. MHG1-6]